MDPGRPQGKVGSKTQGHLTKSARLRKSLRYALPVGPCPPLCAAPVSVDRLPSPATPHRRVQDPANRRRRHPHAELAALPHDPGETPRAGTFGIPKSWRRIIRHGDSPPNPRRYARGVMSSTAAAHRFFAARPRSGALFDAAIAAAALAGTLMLIRHGGVAPAPPVRQGSIRSASSSQPARQCH
jgi:hypothetical protein